MAEIGLQENWAVEISQAITDSSHQISSIFRILSLLELDPELMKNRMISNRLEALKKNLQQTIERFQQLDSQLSRDLRQWQYQKRMFEDLKGDEKPFPTLKKTMGERENDFCHFKLN